jgi:hypothetical protein
MWGAPNAVSRVRTKVNRLWPNSPLVIALHSPDAHLETGLRMCPPEKSRTPTVCCRAVRSLQSDLFGDYREILALFVNFSAKRAEFLCSSDCVTEGEGFEPSVRFWEAKPRCVRKLQIAKPCQRISRPKPDTEFATSPVSIRHRFEPEKRTEGDSLVQSVMLRGV